MAAEPEQGPGQGLVLFRLGTATFGLPVPDVIEILRMVAVTPLPEMPGWMLGVVNLRGSHVPIVDLRRRLGIDVEQPTITSRIIVAHTGERPTGLVVDEVTEVFMGEPDSLERMDSFDRLDQPAPAITRIGASTVVVLDAGTISKGVQDLHLPEGLDADL